MSVIVRKKIKIDDSEVEIKTYLPPGGLSKQDRLRADRLDEALNQRMPIITRKFLENSKETGNKVYQRYKLGQYLREIIDDAEFVSRVDVENKMIFLAIWDHLPEELKPEGEISVKKYEERQHRRKEYLSLCYEISEFDWSEVKWIKRWDDWSRLASYPGLVRDKRIMKIIGKVLDEIQIKPSAKDMREISKMLGKVFPTRKMKDSSVLDDDKIKHIIHHTLKEFLCKSEIKPK